MHSVPKRFQRRPSPVEIALRTGPITAALTSSTVLMIADEQNLSHSARNLGFDVHYKRLGALLNQRAATCQCHAVFSSTTGERERCMYFDQSGWTPHVRDVQVVKHGHLRERVTDADPYILFTAGLLVSRTPASIIILGSGDGHLVSEVAAAISTLPKARKVFTLSLAGSTSHRLKAAHNPYIDGNIELGLDCLIAREPFRR